jgi:hypothetical protein
VGGDSVVINARQAASAVKEDEGGGYMFLRNIGSYKTHKALHPRKLHSNTWLINFDKVGAVLNKSVYSTCSGSFSSVNRCTQI